ncbi:MAG: hypothetical protein ACI4OY_13910, partial [Aristaeellaceae bacterium]
MLRLELLQAPAFLRQFLQSLRACCIHPVVLRLELLQALAFLRQFLRGLHVFSSGFVPAVDGLVMLRQQRGQLRTALFSPPLLSLQLPRRRTIVLSGLIPALDRLLVLSLYSGHILSFLIQQGLQRFCVAHGFAQGWIYFIQVFQVKPLVLPVDLLIKLLNHIRVLHQSRSHGRRPDPVMKEHLGNPVKRIALLDHGQENIIILQAAGDAFVKAPDGLERRPA